MGTFIFLFTVSRTVLHAYDSGDLNAHDTLMGAGAIVYALYWSFLFLLDIYFAKNIIFYARILFEEDEKIMRRIKIIVAFTTGSLLLFDAWKVGKYTFFALYYLNDRVQDEVQSWSFYQYVVVVDLYVSAVQQLLYGLVMISFILLTMLNINDIIDSRGSHSYNPISQENEIMYINTQIEEI